MAALGQDLKKVYNGHGYMKIPHIVEVVARGKKFVEKSDYTPGGPWLSETKTTDEELKDKFRTNAYIILPALRCWQEKMDTTIEKIFNLEKVKNLKELTNLLTP